MEVVTLKNRGDRRTTGPLNVLGPVYKKRGLLLCEGYPCKRVKVSSGLQANFTGSVTLSPGPTLPALLTCFVMCDILCNGLKFEIILIFFMENTLNSQKKKGKYYRRRQKITFFPQMFRIKLRNWILPFKLAGLLVMHDGRKLTRVDELSLAECLQGR